MVGKLNSNELLKQQLFTHEYYNRKLKWLLRENVSRNPADRDRQTDIGENTTS